MEESTRRCSHCGATKPVEQFARDRTRPAGRCLRCRACDAARAHAYYAANAAVVATRRKEERRTAPDAAQAARALGLTSDAKSRLARFRDYHRQLKAGRRCMACGEPDPALLEWHHRDPSEKTFVVSDAFYRLRNAEAIRSEIAKCDVLCIGCHQALHRVEVRLPREETRAERRARHTREERAMRGYRPLEWDDAHP